MIDFSEIFNDRLSVHKLIESLSEGVIFINKFGEIIRVNQKSLDLFAYQKDELIGQNIDILIPSRFKKQHYFHLSTYFDQPKIRPMGHSTSKLLGCKKDGTEIWLEISLSYIRTKYDVFGMAFITDITTRVLAENELIKQNLELDAYAHTIAHELHSQLNSIIGFSQILQINDRLTKEKKDEFLEMIVQSGFKMNSIIREMLLFANRKKEEVVKTQLAMKDIILEALSRISPTEKNSAQIVFPAQFEKSKGYAPWIEEVWFNYIRNGIKYGGNPPKLEIGSNKVENGYIKYWIKDNGNGLSERECELLFIDPQKLGNGFVKGHGLGLSIVKRIVKKLDGWVKIESIPNQGSTFSFYLPK
ncbi:PAS domain-containing sensor histidine kinase [Ancylomarina longa]|uniref:histidine kinase n=1 Tax=Ancylomarina longa TaxID=2487017 RepID=A0A434AFM8_9BACT|nr:PAS domain-containing sensor histidine kinase [Ancylomarina longa]RUT73187.1 PAS domain-containing sensor histidine kinase [Ancylomarina longa]